MALLGFGEAALVGIRMAHATCSVVIVGVCAGVLARCCTMLVAGFMVLRIRFKGLRRRTCGVTSRP